MMTPEPRSYVLILTSGTACLRRNGPSDPLVAGLGRSPREILELSETFFPVSAEAHRAAFLRALEDMTGDAPGPAAAAEREAAVAIESLSAHISNLALIWPPLFQLAPRPELVAEAQTAALDLGVAVGTQEDAEDAAAAFCTLRHAVDAAASTISHGIQGLAGTPRDPLIPHACPPLAEGILRPELVPEQDAREEVTGPYAAERRLSDLLAAKLRHGDDLLERLRKALAARRPRHSDDAPQGLFLSDLTGEGVGTALTASGRLRHVVRMERGKVSAWRADTPADWNFATFGPVIKAVTSLGGDADTARLVIAAYDPSAPCLVEGNDGDIPFVATGPSHDASSP